MKLPCILTLLLLHLRQATPRLNTLKTVNDYMNICLNGKNQKVAPGPEPKLTSQICAPWSARSCCTAETAEGVRMNPRWLNFDWDHCKNLSPRCREHFIMDLCFYECSPNVGPWLVVSVCNNWWNACKNDFTCLDNWAVGFNWSTGINTCPQQSSCRPFHEMYSGASSFCETLMGNSFKVVPDSEDCFVLWFDPNHPNPNEAVARKKASSVLGVPYVVAGNSSENNALIPQIYTVFFLFFIFIYCTLFN